MDGDWYDAVSAAAQSVTKARMNQPRLLPSLADVENVIKVIEADLSSEDYVVMAKAVLTMISIFNRKRGGELRRMKLSDFRIEDSTSLFQEEVLEGLTPTEQKLVNVLARIEIRGKFNRPVPILLTPKMVTAIERLLELRKQLDIDSVYMFASPRGERPFRGPDVLRHYASATGVSSVLFTATNLRKQLATLCQAMEISKMEQDQVAQFLGHDIRVHRNIYRRPLDVIQKAKVASILFRLNRGLGIPTDISEKSLENEELTVEIGADELENSACCSGAEGMVESEREEDMSKTAETENLTEAAQSCREAANHPEEMTSQFDNEDAQQNKRRTLQRKRSVPWTSEEKEAVRNGLRHCLQLCKVPQKYEAEECLAAYPVLRKKTHTWKDVKNWVYNEVKKIRK